MVVCVCCGIRRQVRAECGRASSKGHRFPSFIGTPIPFDGRARPLSRTRARGLFTPTQPGHQVSASYLPRRRGFGPAMLEKGASQPWQKTLFEMTGERQIDATAMIEYFEPY